MVPSRVSDCLTQAASASPAEPSCASMPRSGAPASPPPPAPSHSTNATASTPAMPEKSRSWRRCTARLCVSAAFIGPPPRRRSFPRPRRAAPRRYPGTVPTPRRPPHPRPIAPPAPAHPDRNRPGTFSTRTRYRRPRQVSINVTDRSCPPAEALRAAGTAAEGLRAGLLPAVPSAGPPSAGPGIRYPGGGALRAAQPRSVRPVPRHGCAARAIPSPRAIPAAAAALRISICAEPRSSAVSDSRYVSPRSVPRYRVSGPEPEAGLEADLSAPALPGAAART